MLKREVWTLVLGTWGLGLSRIGLIKNQVHTPGGVVFTRELHLNFPEIDVMISVFIVYRS